MLLHRNSPERRGGTMIMEVFAIEFKEKCFLCFQWEDIYFCTDQCSVGKNHIFSKQFLFPGLTLLIKRWEKNLNFNFHGNLMMHNAFWTFPGSIYISERLTLAINNGGKLGPNTLLWLWQPTPFKGWATLFPSSWSTPPLQHNSLSSGCEIEWNGLCIMCQLVSSVAPDDPSRLFICISPHACWDTLQHLVLQ